MFDDGRPISKALMVPGQPTQFGVIHPVTRLIPEEGESFNYGPSAPILPINNDQEVTSYIERNNWEGVVLDKVNIGLKGHPFSPGQRSNDCMIQPNFKDYFIEALASLPPEIIEGIVKLFVRLLVPHANDSQTPQVPVTPADSQFKDMLQVVLAAYGIKPSQHVVDNIELSDAVKLVFKAMINLKKDLFKKVELTIALQKKLSAHEIAEAIDFLISERGVIVEVEQIKKRNGRNPSPQYRLIWENPKYQRV